MYAGSPIQTGIWNVRSYVICPIYKGYDQDEQYSNYPLYHGRDSVSCEDKITMYRQGGSCLGVRSHSVCISELWFGGGVFCHEMSSIIKISE